MNVLNIKFLGTKGGIEEQSPDHKKMTAVLLSYNAKKLLIDFGKGNDPKTLNDIKPDLILLSHGHTGHIGGLENGAITYPIYGIKNALDNIEGADKTEIKAGEAFNLADFKIIPIEVYHSAKFPAYGFIIQADGQKIGIFTDVLSIPNRAEVLKGLDLYIGGGSSLENNLVRVDPETKQAYGHSSIKTQIVWLKEAGITLAVWTHFGKEAVELGGEKLTQKIKELSGSNLQSETAKDGRVFNFQIQEPDQEEEIEEIEGDELLEVIRRPFGSPGGKSRAADLIIKYFPSHETYVESFIGGGAILFHKKPSTEEIINDKDPLISNAYKVLKEENINKIKAGSSQRDWSFNEERIRKCFASKEKGITGYLDFMYGLRNSFSGNRKSISYTSVNYGKEPNFSNLEKVQERLKNVKILNQDWIYTLKYDSPGTFFYFDPPYPGEWPGPDLGFDLENFVKSLSKIKGKFICSINKENKKFFNDNEWFFKSFKMKRIFKNSMKEDVELLVSNFPMKKNSDWLAEAVLPYRPEEMTDEQLADDRRITGGWYSTLKDTGNFKYTKGEILNKFLIPNLTEILKRGKITFHPEEWKAAPKEIYLEAFKNIVKDGLYLVPPHGQLIYEGKKTVIVKAQNFDLTKPRILISGGKAYGIVRTEESRVISLDEFDKLRNEHQITKEEQTERGKEIKGFAAGPVYCFKIRDFIPFSKPLTIEKPEIGTQGFIKNVKFLEETFDQNLFAPQELEKLDDLDLLRRHADIHQIWIERGARSNDEEVINSHLFVVQELKKRGLIHRPKSVLDEITLTLGGDGASLKEFLDLFPKEGFCLQNPLASLIGSTVVNGYGNDYDFHIYDGVLSPRGMEVLDFCLKEMLPEKIKLKRHLVPSASPFTNYLPFLKLKVEPIAKEDLQLIRMSETFQDDAEKSISEDKIEIFRFFKPLKAQAGYREREVYNIEGLLKVLRKEDYPYIVDQKFDGERVVVHKKGKEVRMFSEDGAEINLNQIPSTVKEISEITNSDSFILDCEGEIWLGNRHLGRSDTSGYLKSEVFNPLMDRGFRLNAFTILYENEKDLHNETELARKELLDQFKSGEHLNIADYILAKDENDIRNAVKEFAKIKYSEGGMVKAASSKYFLTGQAGSWWTKFKNETDIDAEVIDVHPVKGTDAYNYLCIIRDDQGNPLPIGRTYNVRFEDADGKPFGLKAGDIIRVAFVNLNRYTDEKTGKIWFNWWAPRPIEPREDKKKPDTKDAADQLVIATHGEIGLKPFPKRYEEIFKILRGEVKKEDLIDSLKDNADYIDFMFNHFGLEKEGIQDNLLDEAVREMPVTNIQMPEELKEIFKTKNPADYPLNFSILVLHFRGKSVHIDFRRKQDEHLEGETILNAYPGQVTEAIDTIEKGKRWAEILLKEGKFTPDMNPAKVKVVIIPKAAQPIDWLNIREVKFEPGEVGATRFEPGVFITLDDGIVYPGVQKPYFKEFFFAMSRFKGRMAERLIGVSEKWLTLPKEGVQWQAWMTKKDFQNQVPYLLTKRGREKADYVPADGEKAVPPEWEKEIKPEFQWWLPNLTGEEKLKRLDDAYEDLVKRNLLKEKSLKANVKEDIGKFTLRKVWWMGQQVIRSMPVEKWEILIDQGRDYLDVFELEENPLFNEKAPGLRKTLKEKTPEDKPFPEWMNWQGHIIGINVTPGKGIINKNLGNGVYEVQSKSGKYETENFTSTGTPQEFNSGEEIYYTVFGDKNYIYSGKGTDGNPNKEIPITVEILDQGKVNWLEDSDQSASLKFEGKNLKGYRIFKRTSPDSSIWVFLLSRLPGQTKKELKLCLKN